MAEDNPYRSPDELEETPATPFAEDETEVEGAWRWGDMLVVRRKGAVLPAACVRSNAMGKLGVLPIGAARFRVWLFISLSFQVPAVGLMVGSFAVRGMTALGYYAHSRLPVRRSIASFGVMWVIIALFAILAGNMLSAYGLFTSARSWTVLGLALSLAPAFVDWASDRYWLRTALIGNEYVGIQGIHPGYLARLPEFGDTNHTPVFTFPGPISTAQANTVDKVEDSG